MSIIQDYLLESIPSTDEGQKYHRQLVNQLTGPLLTSDERIQQDAQRALDEPPVPLWWDDDDDATESNLAAARQLGQTVQMM